MYQEVNVASSFAIQLKVSVWYYTSGQRKMDFSRAGIRKFKGEDFGLWKLQVQSFLEANELY